jgi:translation initiation factor 1
MFSDPFEKKDNYMIHVRIHQRNGRKSTTTIEGIPTDLDLKKIVRYLRKVYHTNGTIIEEENVIQLQGDQRKNIYEAFTQWNIAPKENITVHGG